MKVKIIFAVIVVILAVGIAGSALVLSLPGRDTVRIISDGEVLYTINLSTAGDTTIEVPCGAHHNTIEIRDHRIRVSEADCPDLTCVGMGWLSGRAMPIVCLPHRLVIEYADSTGDVDAVTG